MLYCKSCKPYTYVDSGDGAGRSRFLRKDDTLSLIHIYITVPQDGIQEGAPVIYNDASEDTSSMDGSWSDGSDEMDGSWSDGSDEMDGSWSDGSDEMDGSWSDGSDDMDADYSDGDAGDGMVYDADQGSYVEDGEQ